ncbi:hypothetical protein Hamer_G029436 [Homarus americanus]|uniref:Uncharacterized protein n=1 Tax=Homarus americanus TaxID=6706 RepID=A0A8J5JAC0_HOMAM|nr:hypothetical protein Hamer_G029436 [Homarus americanus]
MKLMQRMVDVTQQVVRHTTTPLHVVVKVRDVATTYHSPVRAALDGPSFHEHPHDSGHQPGRRTHLSLSVFSP